MNWHYEKMNEDYTIKTVGSYTNDTDSSITGKYVINVKAYFDENPEEARRLGWIKHITYSSEEVDKLCPHNKQTQYVVTSTRQVDEYTVEDTYHTLDKSEEMMLLEEMLEHIYGDGGSIMFFG